MVVRRKPVPRPVITEADVDAARTVVARHKPPNARVEIPARLHEDVVHAFNDAVPVDPNVVAVAVGPVALDPDPLGATNLRLDDDDCLRCGGSVLGRRNGRRLFDHDDGLSIDLLGRAVLSFDDDVGGVPAFLGDHHFLPIAVVRHFESVPIRAAVAIRAFVVRGDRSAEDQQGAERNDSGESNEVIHGPSPMCMSVWVRRHPPTASRAPPARQRA